MSDQAAGTSAQLGTRAVGNSVLILAARTVSRLVSLVVVIVLANALGDTNYGRYTTLIAYSALVSVIADLGFSPLYTREAARNQKELGDYLGTLVVVKLALAVATAVVMAIALDLGAGLPSLIVPGAALLIATAYANLLRNTFYAVGRAEFDIPAFGYLAASTTTVLTEASLCAFGWWFVQRNHPELRLAVIGLSWRILLAGAVMGVVLYPLNRFSIAISLPAGGLVYVVAIYLVRAISRDEWRLARHGLLSRLRPGRAA